ncbi:hypothetical protein DFQ28_009447 [Apophysomyces sp. BC1034]|nr:hypothetical protein DFQ28_009447 [Apophysomyces sp. BC1034]
MLAHCECEALPVGGQVPVAVVDRIDLERLGHQRGIELHAHRRRVGLVGLDLRALDHMPRCDMADYRQRIIQCRKAELQAAGRHAVLARYALVDRVLKTAVELKVKPRVQAPAAAVGLQRRPLYRKRVRARARRECREPGREHQTKEGSKP